MHPQPWPGTSVCLRLTPLTLCSGFPLGLLTKHKPGDLLAGALPAPLGPHMPARPGVPGLCAHPGGPCPEQQGEQGSVLPAPWLGRAEPENTAGEPHPGESLGLKSIQLTAATPFPSLPPAPQSPPPQTPR